VRQYFTSANSSVRLAYFHTNRLLTGLYRTEIRWRKDDNRIKKKTDIDIAIAIDLKPSSNSSQPPNPTPFSLPTSFKLILAHGSRGVNYRLADYTNVSIKIAIDLAMMVCGY
jgi:hypothetical protein